MTKRVRTSRPPPRLTSLVDRPGGLLRDVAIARSLAALEAQRAPGLAAMLGLIGSLEAMTAAPGLPQREQHLLRVTDQLIALAAIFAMRPLEQAGKRLSELLTVFRSGGAFHADAVAVHVRAMRLLVVCAPDGALVAGMMAELDLVLAHFGAKAPS